MKKLTLLFLIASQISCSQQNGQKNMNVTTSKKKTDVLKPPSSKVSYDDFKTLVIEVEPHRAERLINLNEFLTMSKRENTVILDTRSDSRFSRKHIKGAIHLDFTDFTQENLRNLIHDKNTKILIYCNNNIDDDPIDFATKMVIPDKNNESNLALALNIPTYLNLYGYGYKNVYELSELVTTKVSRIEFEGTAVLK